MDRKDLTNIAFIDGQNLHLGLDWKLDFARFRVYLREKYKIKDAYYFLGYVSGEEQGLYTNLQKAGFLVQFKKHNEHLLSQKKGNVDTDIVFEAMKSLIEDDEFDKIFLISGDGDYKKLVDYLIEKEKFAKIIFPNRKKSSSLYRKLAPQFFLDLSQVDLKKKFEFKHIKKKESP